MRSKARAGDFSTAGRRVGLDTAPVDATCASEMGGGPSTERCRKPLWSCTTWCAGSERSSRRTSCSLLKSFIEIDKLQKPDAYVQMGIHTLFIISAIGLAHVARMSDISVSENRAHRKTVAPV